MPSRLTRISVCTVALAAAGSAFYGVGAATADNSVPRTDKEIPNITKVEDSINAFYGGKADASGAYQASPTSNYAKQVKGIETKAKRQIADAARHTAHGRKPAIVLDVDDTTLLTYDYEKKNGFAYNAKAFDDYVQSAQSVAVFGMPDVVNYAAKKGVTVFFLTGRAETQRTASAVNLTKAGYGVPVDKAHFYLQDKTSAPSYLSCASPTWSCTTVQFKSGTRKHIESLGYTIVANFGDQYSDLSGGFADKTYKLPNPMYFLP
ncbi:acid phosphatase [Streptomyces sp. NBC_01267]|uniref:HAD family acid phosphatase n=1 Tax=unclassified Streptomyces TaxID=2593676 RepID=UPI00225511B2|nr:MULTISPECIES: HAD family acid phosphatase [unclassified Streptomyces]MCX4551843.1 acid phosphatase [Streptomyces sp. NBC_01500]WSC23207.1 acid phosphatase [Streptomyces sp. NBC_01766]WSV57118.1 acid phosphatase [Streptomyces sp. NBC_01014]